MTNSKIVGNDLFVLQNLMFLCKELLKSYARELVSPELESIVRIADRDVYYSKIERLMDREMTRFLLRR